VHEGDNLVDRVKRFNHYTGKHVKIMPFLTDYVVIDFRQDIPLERVHGVIYVVLVTTFRRALAGWGGA
jgi:hypothetical protein